MTIAPLAAHTTCAALVAVDLLIRGLRTHACLRGAGHPLPLGRVLEFNLWAEAAAALSPFRVAGEPVRMAGMLHAGARVESVLVTTATEGAVHWISVVLVGLLLVLGFAPEWWREAGPGFVAHVTGALPLVCALIIGMAAVMWWLRRSHEGGRRRHARLRERLRDALRLWAAMPPGIVVYALLLSLVSVSARTLLLPVLSLSVAGHPGFGVLWIGSYMLVYSQVVLPVPGGAGAVDLAFLGGMAGQPGPQAPVLLVAWRTYSLGIATALGGALAVHRFGARPLWVLLRSRTTGT